MATISELGAIDIGSRLWPISLPRRTLVVCHNERLVVVSEPARQAVDLYRRILKERFPGANEGPWLFPADSDSGHLTRQAFARDLKMVAAAAGFMTNAGVVGLYALVATGFPVALRASATGFVIGVGRGGSALAPSLAGLLFALGYGLPVVALLMSLGSVLAACALLIGRKRAA